MEKPPINITEHPKFPEGVYSTDVAKEETPNFVAPDPVSDDMKLKEAYKEQTPILEEEEGSEFEKAA